MPQLDVIQITTHDMAASLAFYRLLGWEIPSVQEGDSHLAITLPNGLRVAWDTFALMQSIHSEWRKPEGHRMVLAFLCEGPLAVDALYAQLIAAGYRGYKAPWDAFWGQRYAVVLDPDGNLVDLFASLG